MSYFSIHNHSMYSFQDGFATPKEYLERATEIGLKGFCITEHENQCSWVYFDEIKKDYPDVKMCYGVELYEAFNIREKDADNKYFHLIVIAKNEKGRQLLNHMVTHSREGIYYKQRVDLDMFRRYGGTENVIVSSACLAGKIAREKDYDKCIGYINEYKKLFPHFYLEMQSHQHIEQVEHNRKVLRLSRDTNTPFIITTDSHASRQEDLYYQNKMVQIAHDSETASEVYEGCYLQSEEEVHEIMDIQIGKENVVKGLRETNRILDMIENVDMPFQEPQLPTFPLPDGFKTDRAYLEYLTNEIGWCKRGLHNRPLAEQEIYKERINYELDIISQMQYDGYFLIVWDFINFAKTNKIEVGVGRGCFTKDALVLTKQQMKPISEVNIGDYVLSASGSFNKVLNTMSYDINEPTIEIEYYRQGSSSKKYKNECTLDHKILTMKDGVVDYVEAQDLTTDHYVCYPKCNEITQAETSTYVDLAKYNYNNYRFDDNYIYEEIPTGDDFDYSYRHLSRIGKRNRGFYRKLTKGVVGKSTKSREGLKEFFELTPFKTLEDYGKYHKLHSVKYLKIPRYLKIDAIWGVFFGLMLGDGCIRSQRHEVQLAINNSTGSTKNTFNRYVFHRVAEKLQLKVSEHIAKNRNLIQFTISSPTVTNWLSELLFSSKREVTKIYNKEVLAYGDVVNHFIKIGLEKSDGHYCFKDNKFSFDNTSTSLIALHKILSNYDRDGVLALDVRLAHTDNRGYNSKESYKLRKPIKEKLNNILEDENYWFLPVLKIKKNDSKKVTVYDLTVDNDPSYTIGNMCVHNSASGSITDWLLGISDLDPIKYGLIFERFLNPERISLPDIDSDFSDRAKVVEYLIERYGEENVCQIMNFSYITPVVAIKDTARIFKVPYASSDKISKLFADKPFEDGLNLCKETLIDYEEYSDLFDIAGRLSGRVRQRSTHAGGVGIVNGGVDGYIGLLQGSKGEQVIQVDKKKAEKIGIVKFDLLGVATLNVLQEVKEELRLSPEELDVNNDTFLNDEKTFKLLCEGRTNGVFQVESVGMKNLLLQVQPKNLLEISDVLALYRPDSMAMLQDYIDRKNNSELISYWHEDVKEILKDTYGCLVYQEQTMDIVRRLGGRSYGGADKFRKGIGSKNKEMIKNESDILKNEIISQGYERKLAEFIGGYLAEMGGYGLTLGSYKILLIR